MDQQWKAELEFTTKIVKSKVFPVLKGWNLGGRKGKVYDIEGRKFDDKLYKILDNFAGIDAIEADPDKGLRGISIRCQWVTNKVFNSFSIRRERGNRARTEFAKRLLQIISREGWIYPGLTVQAYFRKIDGTKSDELLSVGMAYTRDIYEAIIDHGAEYVTQDGNIYKQVSWEKMKELGYYVRIHTT